MQIRIEIDVKPEELRRFLGLPDVSGLQEDIVAFVREKLGAAGEFDAGSFVRQNFDTLRNSPAWQKIVARIRVGEDGVATVQPADKPPRAAAARKRTTVRKRRKPAGTGG